MKIGFDRRGHSSQGTLRNAKALDVVRDGVKRDIHHLCHRADDGLWRNVHAIDGESQHSRREEGRALAAERIEDDWLAPRATVAILEQKAQRDW